MAFVGANDAASNGQIFTLSSNGAINSLYSFSEFVDFDTNTDGAQPTGGITLATDGSIYGTTSTGGYGTGVIYKIDTANNFIPLVTLDAIDGNGNNFDGSELNGLIQGTDGLLYGTAPEGGANGGGTIFKIDSQGNFTLLYTFSDDTGGSNNDGSSPRQNLLQAADGLFYGCTENGGTNDQGVIFRIDSAGATYSVLYTFWGQDGASPCGNLVQDRNGIIYGTTTSGGYSMYTNTGDASGNGTIFKIDTIGHLATLYSFSVSNNRINTDGANPASGLTWGRDGYLYGTTESGGRYGNGTIFKIDTAGNLTPLHSFSALDTNFLNTDGAKPKTLLAVGQDGNLYGTTSAGGPNGNGTMFSISTAGVFQTLGTGMMATSIAPHHVRLAHDFIDLLPPVLQKQVHRVARRLNFTWNGKVIHLFYPPLLIKNHPYVYAGYLGAGMTVE